MQASSTPLIAQEQLETPILIDCYEVVFDKGVLGAHGACHRSSSRATGKEYKKDAQLILEHYAEAPAYRVQARRPHSAACITDRRSSRMR